MKAPLAVSLGDPAGVGPELIAAAWARRVELDLPPFVVVGGAGLLRVAAKMRGLAISVEPIANLAEAAAVFARALPVLGDHDAPYAPGLPTEEGARLALVSLTRGTALARTGEAAALVTLPIAKAELAKAGFIHPGQTEFIAEACDMPAEAAVMMLAGPSLRAVPLTVHCALADVAKLLSIELIVRKGRIVAEALRRDFGIAVPRLAVCGLNPHAGEQGRIGSEDAAIIAPAIAQLRAEGIDATGPHPADALFAPRARATYDAALAMYHDQALIPVKALDFDQGVNVTLGLRIVRTSPDHGTAFDIAGKGVADEGATVAAIRMAGEIAARRSAHAASGAPPMTPPLPPLREVIARHGLAASKALGQNFLFDEQLLARIAAIPGDLAGKRVLEVGPGPGGLTRALLRAGARVTAIEMDRRCLPALAELGDAFPGQLSVIPGDALKLDHNALMEGEPYAVLSNLPYNVGTALFVRWLGGEAWPPQWTSLTLMFQQEVAQRITAAPDTRAYGRLAVLAQWRSTARLALKVHRSAFTPAPKVMSAIVHVEPAAMPQGVSARVLERVTEAAFGQRRKMLRQSLKGVPGALEALDTLTIDPQRRAETLEVAQFVEIARRLSG